MLNVQDESSFIEALSASPFTASWITLLKWHCVFSLTSAKNAMSTIPQVFLSSQSCPISLTVLLSMTLNHREGRKALRHELKDSWAQLSNTLLCCLHYLKYEFLGKKEQGKLQILQIITDSKALLPNCLPLLLR